MNETRSSNTRDGGSDSTVDGGEVLYVVTDGVATITLNRPESRNAINGALRRGMWRSFEQAEADPDVSVVVLTGSDPAFCAGLDLREVGKGNPEVIGSQVSGSSKPFPTMTKPIIGAINGAAITGGFELALNCDFLIVSEKAAFADTHARVGVMPGWGLTALLVDAVGAGRAREISLTGNFVTATEATEWGLANRMVAHEDLMAAVYRLAADIVGNDQIGVARMLATYAEQQETRLADAWRLEGEASVAFRGQIEFEPAEVEARRQAIIDRGRSQL